MTTWPATLPPSSQPSPLPLLLPLACPHRHTLSQLNKPWLVLAFSATPKDNAAENATALLPCGSLSFTSLLRALVLL